MDSGKKFQSQYNKTYHVRLNHFRPVMETTIEKKWGTRPLASLFKINETANVTAIQGLLYVYSKLKPSIFSEVNLRGTKEVASTYYSEDITFFVEDESGRIEIRFEDKDSMYKKYKILSTGMFLGFLGSQYKKSVFNVTDICFPGCLSLEYMSQKSTKICLISCMEMEKDNMNFEKLMIVLKYLESEDIDNFVLMGRFFAEEQSTSSTFFGKLSALSRAIKKKHAIVPGIGDPTSKILPQQPLHKRFFNTNANIDLLPNPAVFSIENYDCLASSGENVYDLLKYLPETAEKAPGNSEAPLSFSTAQFLDAMETIMMCQYISPTSPDTMKSEPVEDEDPFIIQKPLHFFFCGNSPGPAVRKVGKEKTCFVSVPNFRRSESVMLFDTLDLSYKLIKCNAEELSQ